jgi:hypothetical protein
VRLCESKCGDRQEQEGKRLPAHPLIELRFGWGRKASIAGLAGDVLSLRCRAFAEVSVFAGFEVLLPGRCAVPGCRVLLSLLGTAGEALGYDRHLKADTPVPLSSVLTRCFGMPYAT